MSDEPESLQTLNSLDCWDYTIELECLQGNLDLQLAAELGKTLLERNKELENTVKQQQIYIDDQTQEIEYLTKQTVALREVNDSRLRIYEQLEVSIQDLERAHHRLILDHSAAKKHSKTLSATIELFETKFEDQQGIIDDLTLQVDVLKKRLQRTSDAHSPTVTTTDTFKLRRAKYDEDNRPVSPDSSAAQTDEKCDSSPSKTDHPTQVRSVTGSNTLHNEDLEPDSGMEQLTQLLAQLSKVRSQCSRDERRIAELEEQLATMVQQNQALENQVVQLSHRGDDTNMKSMHEELTTLEEVRQGQMCSRCLRSLDHNGSEVPDEDDDSSMLDDLMTSSSQHRSSFSMDVQDNRLEDILRREMSIVWISPAANVISVLVDLCLYVKDIYLIPFLSKPFKIPFILLHYCLRHKLH